MGGGTNCCDIGSGACYATTQTTCPVGYLTSTPPAAFIDACSLPGHTTVLQSQQQWAAAPTVSLPFTFTFYGVPVTQAWLQSQGTMGMGPAPTAPSPNSYPSCTVSNSTTAYPALVAFGDSSLATGAQGVCAATTGTAPNRQYVATWSQATDRSDPGSVLTFSIVLTETTNTIDFVYETMAGGADGGLDATVAGASATVGIQTYLAGALRYTAWSCAKAFIASTPLDVRFTPQ